MLISSCYSDQCLKESTKAAAPAFTFTGRHEQKQKMKAPSPNTYNTAGLTAKGFTQMIQLDKYQYVDVGKIFHYLCCRERLCSS